MTEQEKLHRAKYYVDSLANGLNLLDGTPIPEQDIVNNVRISRCLFFVSDVLRKQIDVHEPKKYPGRTRTRFTLRKRKSCNMYCQKRQYLPVKSAIK